MVTGIVNSNEGILAVNVPKTLVDRFKEKSNYNSSKVIETGINSGGG